MSKNPLRWIAGCACLLLIGMAFITVPAGAVELDPVGSASSNTVTIANGDSVLIHGIATGHPRNGLQLWIISHNYLKVATLPVNDDNTYLYELKPADTQDLASGQYFFVVQHPMMNGQFDVVYDPSSGTIINRQLGNGNGMKIFTISGAGSLQGPDSAQALVNAISSQNIDDTFATYSFFISPPTAFINPIGDHYAGDKFTLTGSTNLAAGDQLMIEVTSSSFKPTQKSEGSEFSGTSGVVNVVPGSGGYNRWSFDVDATAYKPDEYIVKVSAIRQDVTASAYFNIVNGLPPTSLTTIVTLPETTAVSSTTLPPQTIATTPQSPLPCWIALGAVLFVMAGIRKRC
jgi:trimeric autotransporter adhesin